LITDRLGLSLFKDFERFSDTCAAVTKSILQERKMAKKPNILWLLSDQHNKKVAGYEGDAFVQTPHLDALAESSVIFDNAVTPNPLCTPARICMLTGKEAHRCSAYTNHWPVFPEHLTWPGHFANNGYRTCLVGKMHLGGKNQLAGFQYRPYGDLRHGVGHQPDPLAKFPGYANVRSAGITELPETMLQDFVAAHESLAFIREHADREPDVPWFLCASFTRPHAPLTAPGRYIRRYRGKLPPAEKPPLREDYASYEPYARNFIEKSSSLISREEAQAGYEAYYACVDFLDDCIGDLLNGLQKDGLLDNTYIIYTADHGEMLGRHGIWGKKLYYEPSINVPLLISGPGITGGKRAVGPVSTIDLYPTFCSLAGLPIPEGLDGVDVSSLLTDPENARPRDFAASSYYQYGIWWDPEDAVNEMLPHKAMRVIREERWKYAEVEQGEALLFDLADDPEERVNLAQDPAHQERVRLMRGKLYRDFSWDEVHRKLAGDRERRLQVTSGMKPTTPNQYMLADGRLVDAERDLYDARWIVIPEEPESGGHIPQYFG
jgi:choline-sulfatase